MAKNAGAYRKSTWRQKQRASSYGEVGLAGARLINDLAVEHNDQAVGELEQFVEIFADQQYGGAAKYFEMRQCPGAASGALPQAIRRV